MSSSLALRFRNVRWAKSSALYGTIDGCGYAIKNLKLNTKAGGNYAVGGGMFANLYGEVKNVAFINVTLDNGSQGGSAGVICGVLQM